MSEAKPAFLRRVKLRNYKSIRECDVSLGPLTFLVGPNGSGKSNFLDALRFVSDCLRGTLRDAVRERGGIREVLRRQEQTHAECSTIELDLALRDDTCASYRLTVRDVDARPYINEESCSVNVQGSLTGEFRVRDGKVTDETSIPTPPSASAKDLYLQRLSSVPEFAPVYELLRGMRFYNIEPQRIRQEAMSSKPTDELLYDGTGALYITQQAYKHPRVWERMHEYLRAILPTLSKFDVQTDHYGPSPVGGAGAVGVYSDDVDCRGGQPRSLKFVLSRESAPCPSLPPSQGRTMFDAQSMSDGTLRAFGVILALFQCVDRPADDAIPLVGIEEPETTLHPAAAGVLFDALHEASHFTQVIVTTHSAELLNIKDLDPGTLQVVDLDEGETIIGPADEVSLSAMKDRMYTAGELLEMNQLKASPRPAREAAAPRNRK